MHKRGSLLRFTIRHIIETDVDSFWEMYFDEAYNDAMYKDELKFSIYELLSLTRQDDGSVLRRTNNGPPIELPAAIKRVGAFTSYIEEGRYDPRVGRWIADFVPASMGEKTKTHAEVWVEPRGDKRCERFAEVDVRVKIFGVGKLVEKFVEQQTCRLYEDAARFTNQWIADKGL